MVRKGYQHTVAGACAMALIVVLAVFTIFGTRHRRELVGTWVVDTAGIEQGFQCGKDGLAASINNKHKQYSSWSASRNRLILNGKLFEDYRVYDFSDTLTIVKLNKGSLTVEENGHRTEYRKTR